MIIFPTENPANRFIHTPKALHEDNTMSWKAKGMIAWMSSHSENYQLHMSVLLKISTEGRDSVYSGLKEICIVHMEEKLGILHNIVFRFFRGDNISFLFVTLILFVDLRLGFSICG